jgi:DNA polymerase III delta prime subunit
MHEASVVLDLPRKYRPQSLPDVCGQTTVVKTIKKWIKDKQIPQIIALFGQSGCGKALPLSAPVLTPTGYVKMSDLKEGDLVIGSDGWPTKITGVFPQGKLDIYEVKLDDNTSVESSFDHLWTVYSCESLNETEAIYMPRTLTTEDIQNELITNYSNEHLILPLVQSVEHVAPVTDDVAQLNKNCWYPQDIDPYLLGALIGGGQFDDFRNVQISCTDRSCVDDITRNLMPDSYQIDLSRVIPIIRITDLQYAVKIMEIVSKTRLMESRCAFGALMFFHPWIPFLSTSTRVLLLRGIIDSGGTKDKTTGVITYTAFTNGVVESVAALVRSLGGIASVKTVLDKFMVTIAFPMSNSIFPDFGFDPRHTHRKICGIRNTGRKELCQCIKVEAENGLFVIDNYTLTHNTTIARILTNELGVDTKDHMSYQELNVADDTGIETARDLNTALLRPSIHGKNRNKVFFLDEVASMSKPAQNALLKPLEEIKPNQYVIFSTTNPEKLIAPLKNRATVLQLKPLTAAELSPLLERVLKAEEKELDDSVKKILLESSIGSPRQMLSLLQRVLTAVKPENQLAMLAELNGVFGEGLDSGLPQAALDLAFQLTYKEKLNVQGILTLLTQALESSDPEPIRLLFLSYMRGAIVKWTNPANDKATNLSKLPILAQMMRCFGTPYYNPGSNALIYADVIQALLILQNGLNKSS